MDGERADCFVDGDIDLFGYLQNKPTNYIDPSEKFFVLFVAPAAYTGAMALADLALAGATSWWVAQQSNDW